MKTDNETIQSKIKSNIINQWVLLIGMYIIIYLILNELYPKESSILKLINSGIIIITLNFAINVLINIWRDPEWR